MSNATIRMKVAKLDFSTGAPLAGAIFKVVADVSGTPAEQAIPGYDNIVTATSPVIVSGLPAGTYWLVETRSPVGTDTDGKPVYYQTAAPEKFTVTNQLLEDNQLVSIAIRDKRTDVTILKLDSALAGREQQPHREARGWRYAHFDPQGRSDRIGRRTPLTAPPIGQLNTGLLEPGQTYVLSETVANTPEGYLCAYDAEFTLANDGKAQWIVVDEPIPTKNIVIQKQWERYLQHTR